MALHSSLSKLLWWIGAIVVDLIESAIFLYVVVWKARPDPRFVYQASRFAANIMLAAALALAAASWGWDIGALAWAGAVVVATLFVALALMPMPRLLLCTAPSVIVLGFIAVSRLLF